MANKLYRGIYAILDLDRIAPALPDDPDEELKTLLRYVTDAVAAGACAIQLRAKSVPGHSLWLPQLLGELRDAVDGKVPIVVNDHIEALQPLTPRDGFGVHVGQDDLPPQHARSRLGGDVLLGLSTHTLEQVNSAQLTGADYIGFGPVRDTSSKANPDATTGIDGLAAACAESSLPVVAIGGLGEDDIADVVAAGARCAAVIGAWLGDDGAPNGPNFARMAMQDLVAAWRAADKAS